MYEMNIMNHVRSIQSVDDQIRTRCLRMQIIEYAHNICNSILDTEVVVVRVLLLYVPSCCCCCCCCFCCFQFVLLLLPIPIFFFVFFPSCCSIYHYWYGYWYYYYAQQSKIFHCDCSSPRKKVLWPPVMSDCICSYLKGVVPFLLLLLVLPPTHTPFPGTFR